MREFCPRGCYGLENNRWCDAPTYLSDTDRSKDRCWHLDDEVIDPIQAEMKWTRDTWRPVQIVGQNGDDWILDDLSRVKKGGPLIRRT